jgi:hypothetical protein
MELFLAMTILFACIIVGMACFMGKPLQIVITHKQIFETPPQEELKQLEDEQEKETQESLSKFLSTINTIMMGGDPNES